MPEFMMDTSGTVETPLPHPIEWHHLDEFTQGYIEAMFFTETAHGVTKGEWHGLQAEHDNYLDGCLPEDASFGDIAPATLAEIVAQCRSFQVANRADLGAACSQGCYSMRRAGNDFWFTRNRHGVGYWDRDLGPVGDTLTKAAHAAGEVWADWGDDGKVYVS